jgi:hypothetical protein
MPAGDTRRSVFRVSFLLVKSRTTFAQTQRFVAGAHAPVGRNADLFRSIPFERICCFTQGLALTSRRARTLPCELGVAEMQNPGREQSLLKAPASKVQGGWEMPFSIVVEPVSHLSFFRLRLVRKSQVDVTIICRIVALTEHRIVLVDKDAPRGSRVRH